MNQREAAQVLATLTVAFRAAGKEFTEPQMQVWFDHLNDVDFSVAMVTANAWIAKEPRFPTIAEFRQRAKPRVIPEMPALPTGDYSEPARAIAHREINAARAFLRGDKNALNSGESA